MENLPQSPQDNDDEYISDALKEQHILDELLEPLEELRARLQTNEVQAIIDQILAKHDPDGVLDATAVLLQHGKAALPAEYYALLEIQDKLLREYGALVGEADEQKTDDEFAVYVLHEAQAILTSVNGDKLSSGVYSSDERALINAAIADLRQLVWELQRSDAMAEVGYDIVEQSRLILSQMHLLHDDTASSKHDRVTGVFSPAELNRAAELTKRYRKHDSYPHPDAGSRMAMLPLHNWQVTLTDDQRAHLEQHLRSVDADRELAHISIEGVSQLPFSFDALDIQRVLRDVPPIILEGLHRITFQSKPEDVADDSPIGDEWKELARHSHDIETNSAEIIIWLDTIKSRYDKQYEQHMEQYKQQPNQESLARAMTNEAARQHLKHTLYYELGHAFHTILPVSLLNDWDTAVHHSMDSYVSEYVERIKIMQTDMYDVENFADVFALCMRHNRGLESTAPESYDAMQGLIASTQAKRQG